MRKQLMRQSPVRARRTVIQAIVHRFARMRRIVPCHPAPDSRDLDQRVREIGER